MGTESDGWGESESLHVRALFLAPNETTPNGLEGTLIQRELRHYCLSLRSILDIILSSG